jgi:hypothetical protein
MIDMFALVVTLSIAGYVVLRAIKLDRELEWFPRPRNRAPDEAPEAARPASSLQQALSARQGQDASGTRPRRR